MKNIYWRIAYILIVLVAVVFTIRQVHEPDLWWQLRTGEYILEHGQVPQTDVFSITYNGLPWVNVKWGFEVIQATTVKLFGPEFIFLPQVFANVGILLLLWFTMRYFTKDEEQNHLAITITGLLLLIGFSYRMNGRPELVSHLFTAVYLFLFIRLSKGKHQYMWLFIPLQLAWANLHEGFGVGIVLLIIYCGTLWLQYFTKTLKSKNERKLVTRYSVIAVLAYLSVAIHPMGTTMLGYPYNIFTQLSANQFTTELVSASTADYWQFAAYINLFFMALTARWLYKTALKNGKFLVSHLQENVHLYYIFILLAFAYLSFASYRNIPFFLIASAPVVVGQLSAFTKRINQQKSFYTSVAASVLLYLSIVSNGFYKTFLPNEKYGIGIPHTKNSVGAATFIAEHQLSGNCFSDYLGSAYLLWHLQPNFKTFMDLRDLDVFEADDMEAAISCVKYPERRLADGRPIWAVVDAKYKFDYVVVLNNPAFSNLHKLLYQGNTFEPVYADELNTIYLRKNKANSQLIAQLGYHGGNTIWAATPPLQQTKAAWLISKFFNPLSKLNIQSPVGRADYFYTIGITPK